MDHQVSEQIQVGIYVNNRAAVFLESYPLATMLAMAVEVEEMGFHSVWVGDSVLAKPRFSPVVTLAAVAARTKRVRLGTSIFQPLFRNPVLVAQEWTTLDVISGGRAIVGLGLGAGGPAALEHELGNLGVEKTTRGRRFEEQLAVLKQLWTESTMTHNGEFYHLRDVKIGYQSVQRPHPPLWVAAGSYVSRNPEFVVQGSVGGDGVGTFHGPFDRVARFGDGWLTAMATPEEYGSTLQHIQQLATERYGRAPDAIQPALQIWINVNNDRAAARREARALLEVYSQVGFDDETIDRWVVHGSVDECLERLGQYVEAGVRTFVMAPGSLDHPGQIRRVGEQLLPRMSELTPMISNSPTIRAVKRPQ